MSRRKRKRDRPAATPPDGRQHGAQQQRGSPQLPLTTVTAVLLTPDDFPGELGDSFHDACAALGLESAGNGYGLVLAQDSEGALWTQITTDAQGVASVRSIWDMGIACGYQPPGGSVVAVRPGWSAGPSLGPGDRREPHDPAGMAETGVPGAGVPGAGVAGAGVPGAGVAGAGVAGAGVAGAGVARWAPARRRRMADIIAAELADMPGQTMEEYIEAELWDAYNLGDTDPSPPPPRLIDMRVRIEPDHATTRRVVDRALAAAWSLAAAGRPPSGSVRTRTLRPGKARLVRANGDGWSLIGRTDGPVLLVADELPGIPVDIGDAPRVAALLDALTGAAGRAVD